MLRQKPHVRFLEALLVRAVEQCSRPPDPISATARTGVEQRPHGGNRRTGSPSGSVGHCQMIPGGRNSHPWPSCVPKAAEARRSKDYGIGSNPFSARDLASAEYSYTTTKDSTTSSYSDHHLREGRTPTFGGGYASEDYSASTIERPHTGYRPIKRTLRGLAIENNHRSEDYREYFVAAQEFEPNYLTRRVDGEIFVARVGEKQTLTGQREERRQRRRASRRPRPAVDPADGALGLLVDTNLKNPSTSPLRWDRRQCHARHQAAG